MKRTIVKLVSLDVLFSCICRMSDGGLLLSWNDSSHTTYMKEEVDRLVCEQINTSQGRPKVIAKCSYSRSISLTGYYVIALQL